MPLILMSTFLCFPLCSLCECLFDCFVLCAWPCVCICSCVQPDPSGASCGGHPGCPDQTLPGNEQRRLSLHLCRSPQTHTHTITTSVINATDSNLLFGSSWVMKQKLSLWADSLSSHHHINTSTTVLLCESAATGCYNPVSEPPLSVSWYCGFSGLISDHPPASFCLSPFSDSVIGRLLCVRLHTQLLKFVFMSFPTQNTRTPPPLLLSNATVPTFSQTGQKVVLAAVQCIKCLTLAAQLWWWVVWKQ